MKNTVPVALWLLSMLPLVAACGDGDAPASGLPSATTAAAVSATGAAAPVPTLSAAPGGGASAGPTFQGKLTPAMVRDYKAALTPGMKVDQAVKQVEATLGPATQTTSKYVTWAAADDQACASFSIEKSGDSVVTMQSGSPVESKHFREQWGKLCLLRAGVSPARNPYTGKVYSVASYAAEARSLGSKPARVEGTFVSVQEDPGGYTTIVLADAKDAAAKVTCKLELGASPPGLKEKEKVLVEGSAQGESGLNECFLVKTP